jgi:hypothetical protein
LKAAVLPDRRLRDGAVHTVLMRRSHLPTTCHLFLMHAVSEVSVSHHASPERAIPGARAGAPPMGPAGPFYDAKATPLSHRSLRPFVSSAAVSSCNMAVADLWCWLKLRASATPQST